jgi:hypothetical protein
MPEHRSQAFNCPTCNVYAKQTWFYLNGNSTPNGIGHMYSNNAFEISKCESCNTPSIWWLTSIIYPRHSVIEIPNADLPLDIQDDYNEARNIANFSPRGAAALLRLSIQKLCKHLGQPGKNINEDIKALVTLGLPPLVQQALDSVRVIGNDAVHPGTIDLKDDKETVGKLFRLVNFITQKTITEPREINEIYQGLPADKLRGIDQRDAQK